MNTFVVGLTGGIGSGKSTIANLFALKGIDIVNADLCSRIVVEKEKPALEKITAHFGKDILLHDGTLDRAKLRIIIFHDLEEKKWLENLLHPLIHEEILQQLNESTSVYAILESPLLIETSQKTLCDRILVVDIDEDRQVERVAHRDQNNTKLIRAIIATQAPRSYRKTFADDIIDNTGDASELPKQVEKLHQIYLQRAKEINESIKKN